MEFLGIQNDVRKCKATDFTENERNRILCTFSESQWVEQELLEPITWVGGPGSSLDTLCDTGHALKESVPVLIMILK